MIHHVSTLEMAGDGVDVFVFGDLQQTPDGVPGADRGGFVREAWQEFRREFKASKNAWAIGLGDYGDWLRPSMRAKLKSAMGDDDSARAMLDNMVLKAQDSIIDSMDFLDRRLIGIHEGHHTHYLTSGGNIDQRLAAALHAPYLGWSATTRLVLKTYGKDGPRHVVTMLSMHGNANGRKPQSALSWLDANFASSWIADVYLMGHGCKSASMAPFERQAVRREGPAGITRSIPRLMVVGGFARGFTDGWKTDYVERAGFSPQPLGWGVVRIRPIWRKAAALAKGVTAARHDGGGASTMTISIETVNRYFTE